MDRGIDKFFETSYIKTEKEKQNFSDEIFKKIAQQKTKALIQSLDTTWIHNVNVAFDNEFETY